MEINIDFKPSAFNQVIPDYMQKKSEHTKTKYREMIQKSHNLL